jgi:mono/diheme cytochrome c family protein
METRQEFHPSIPETWDDLRTLEVPLADPKHSPVEVPWEFYYRVMWRPIYKSYPVYAPGHEPPGYFDWLKQQEPQVIWGIDSGGASHTPPLETEADWIKVGEMVFDAPIAYDTDPWGSSVVGIDDVRQPAWYAATGTLLDTRGVMPFARYVIRKKGVVELGQQSCGMCHTRVMRDGAVVKGAQGNFPFDRAAAFELQKLVSETANKEQLLERVRLVLRSSFDAPWLTPDPAARLRQLSLEEVVAALKAIPPGAMDRGGSSLFYPVQIPDLIGLKDRRYLDHTGLVQQRSIGDLMRYAALNQDMKGLARYGDFIPEGIGFKTLPDPIARSRYRDEQLYALGLYIYSLQPPPNPNQFDAAAAQGRKVFEREGCVRCHTPPLYTNNKLTPAQGFTPSADELEEYDILPASVGTDPNLALKTRRGTGFYKVPTLRGLWYRGMFPHDGSCATLEDWFDSRRLREDYVPTGFKGYGVRTHAVKGHPFGLNLSPDDKKALIAFLKTL